MPLEKFFSGEQPINVKDLTIENPEAEGSRPFDSEKEITEEDWKRMKDGLLEDSRDKTWNNVLFAATGMKLLSPERFAELGVENEEYLEGIRSELDNSRKNADAEKDIAMQDDAWLSFFANAMLLKLLYPDKAAEFVGTGSDDLWGTLGGICASEAHKKRSDMFAAVTAAAILFPDSLRALPSLPKGWWREAMEAKLAADRREDFEDFLAEAAFMRLAFPDERAKTVLDGKEWKRAREHLNKNRNNGTQRFVWDALSLKLLAAEKVEVAENGAVSIAMPRPTPGREPPKTPPLPEYRNF